MERYKKQSMIKSTKLSRFLFYKAMCLIGIMALCGCKANHEIEVTYNEDVEEIVTVQASVKTTRVPSSSTEAQVMTWSNGDAFCFYNNDAAGAVFRLVSGAGSDKGTFAGDSMHGMTKAIYPVSCMHLGLEEGFNELMLPLGNQVQIGNNNNKNLSPFSYMIGQVDEHAPTNMVFSLLVAQVKWELQLPEHCKGEVTQLEVYADSGEEIFIESLCPSNPKKSTMSNLQTLKLVDTELDENNMLTAYMMMAPVAFEKQSLTVRVSMTHLGDSYYFDAKMGQKTVNMQAGYTYLIHYNLKGNS